MTSLLDAPVTRTGLEKTRDVALIVASVALTLALLFGAYVLIRAGQAVDQIGGDSGVLPSSQSCTFEQADQQGRCPGDPDYGTGAS